MNIHMKSKGGLNIECWIEVYDPNLNDWEIAAECKVIDSGDAFLVDEIFTRNKYRRQGYASAIISKLSQIKPVIPIGITKTGEEFWKKLGMSDGLGSEDGSEYEQLMVECSEFDFKIEEAV